MDEKQAFRFDDVILTDVGQQFEADLSVIMSYRPALFGWACPIWDCSKELRFVTRKEIDGKYSWQPKNLQWK